MAQNRRHQLHLLLEALMDGSGKVYYQPTSNIQLSYPCLVYERDGMDTNHANNLTYTLKDRYQVTYMTREVDSEMPHRLASLPLTSFERHFQSGYVYHDVFALYF